eukprot:CAMPEP_0180112656 /NCGR_PEP_ID=MMETSP0985-20121206/36323_1 /TAXON_ID=483367 /ORGANISM="non described non described, Strain CCMP 2436" /LENGTH=213 /DNA_ID=CAMNT_0022051023 /DNA_START=100 /DNA_END=745 /DNA_ORIENTATION=-
MAARGSEETQWRDINCDLGKIENYSSKNSGNVIETLQLASSLFNAALEALASMSMLLPSSRCRSSVLSMQSDRSLGNWSNWKRNWARREFEIPQKSSDGHCQNGHLEEGSAVEEGDQDEVQKSSDGHCQNGHLEEGSAVEEGDQDEVQKSSDGHCQNGHLEEGSAVEEGDQDEVPDRREGKKCHEGRVQVPVPRDCERQEQAEEDLEGEKQII